MIEGLRTRGILLPAPTVLERIGLYVSDARATYQSLDPMIGAAVDFRVIGENWDETLRLVSTICIRDLSVLCGLAANASLQVMERLRHVQIE